MVSKCLVIVIAIFILGIAKATTPWRVAGREKMLYAVEKLNYDAGEYGFQKDHRLIQIVIAPKQLIYLAERIKSESYSQFSYSERHYVFELQPSTLGKANAICIKTSTLACGSWTGNNKPESSFVYKLTDSVEGAMTDCYPKN